MMFARCFRFLRYLSLFNRLFTGPSAYFNRKANWSFRIFGFNFGRAVSAVGNRAAVIAGSASTNVVVKGSNGRSR